MLVSPRDHLKPLACVWLWAVIGQHDGVFWMLVRQRSWDGSGADVAAGQVGAVVVMGIIIRGVLTLTVARVGWELLSRGKRRTLSSKRHWRSKTRRPTTWFILWRYRYIKILLVRLNIITSRDSWYCLSVCEPRWQKVPLNTPSVSTRTGSMCY